MIKIDFEVETKYGMFRDALHLAEDHTFTEEQIEAMKQLRADNWVAHVETASSISEEPVEETPTE